MPDMIGSVPVPAPPTVAPFPLTGDYGGGIDYAIQVATHVFDQINLKTEQRYLMGTGARRFRFQRDHLSCSEYDNLKAHWLSAQGVYAQFAATIQKPSGAETLTVRYENPNIQFDHLIAMIASVSGLTLFEVPATTPTYAVTGRVTRFPDATLTGALENQVQQMIPLLTIRPRGSTDVITLSNQRCNVDGVLYLPRILDWSGIAQTINETSDSAQFTLGNADDVFVTYANGTDLFRSRISFDLYHVNSQYLISLWGGYARPWTLTSDGHFVLPASDGVFELTLSYPYRKVSRTCWKVYKGPYCPSTSALPDCPKDYDSCVARGVQTSFGGIQAEAQTVHIMDNSTGVLGFGRSRMQSVSVTNDTIYERAIQEVYTDIPQKVVCDVAAGRDESEFYSALGIVSEGPIGAYSSNLTLHTLDAQPPHDPLHRGGWRGILGTDPAGAQDYFGIDQAPWNVIPPNSTYAGGVAFAEIRRTDAAGLQLAPVADRAMTVTVTQGIGGWTWTAPGARVWTPGLSNPVWVAINVYLRGIGMRADQSRASLISAATMETMFDVSAAITAAGYCDAVVPNPISGGSAPRFTFRGVLKEQKPLKDWIQEILNCCSGYYTFSAGKLFIGIRADSAVRAGNAFTRNNILLGSLQASPVTPRFNWLVGQFGDKEFDWQLNSVTIYDIDHATRLGDVAGMPQYLTGQMSFVGTSSKDECARLVVTRLREELGGYGMAQITAARNLRFRTTLLSLRTQVGDIISLDHNRLPGARTEARVTGWVLNPDFSIDIEGGCTTDLMYDPTFGPSPADVPATPPPPFSLSSIDGLAWMPNAVAPFAGDPLYPDPRERTFDLWQDYSITREGNWATAIWISGEEAVNRFTSILQPTIASVTPSSGGAISGPCVVYVSIVQRDAKQQPSEPSNLYSIYIPAGTNNQKLTIAMTPAAGTWTDWELYMGTDRRRLALQVGPTAGAPPANYVYTGALVNMSRQLPDGAADRVRVQAKHVWHSGVAGVLVTGIVGLNGIQCNDFIGSPDNWVGRYLSALADLSDGSAPLWNFTVTGFNSSTGVLTVSPNCVIAGQPENSVEAGDVLIARSVGITSGTDPTLGDWVEDPLWNNFVSRHQFPGTNGLDPDAEVGNVYRILRGTGAGQVRTISHNTNVRLYVTPPFTTLPDATSVGIVEAHDWEYASITTALQTARTGVDFELRVDVPNLANLVALVGGFLVDDQGRLTNEEFVCLRELFVYGEPPHVRVVGPEANDPVTGLPWAVFATDTTIRADTSLNDVTVELMALGVYAGRTLYLVNDAGPNNLIVNCAPGEFLFDGLDTVSVAPFETLKVTAG